MKKKVFGRRFKRDINQRTALFRNLMRSLILNEEIKTTEAKAKAVKSQIEKLITKARGGESAVYHLQKHIQEDAARKLVGEVAPRFSTRPGGYTRIVKLGNRKKDNAEMVLLELVEKGEKALPVKAKVAKREQKEERKADRKSNKPKHAKDESKVKTAAAPKRTVTRQKKG